MPHSDDTRLMKVDGLAEEIRYRNFKRFENTIEEKTAYINSEIERCFHNGMCRLNVYTWADDVKSRILEDLIDAGYDCRWIGDEQDILMVIWNKEKYKNPYAGAKEDVC